ncbi:hypothetical protein RY27_13270, partial [Litorilinea aerophila]
MVLVALVVLLLVSACAAPPPPQAGAPASGEEQSAATTEGPQPGGTLIIGKSTEAVGLDPHLVTARSSFEVIAQVY